MDPMELRAEIPALDGTAYLNWGASGPSPRRVVEAAEACLEHQEYESPGAEGIYTAAYDALDEAREAIAGLIGASADEIALTQSTSDGISRVACAVDWEPGDTVVRTDLEHPAGIFPWKRVSRTHGVDVEVLETDRGRIDRDDVIEAAADARLFCVSAVDWFYGTRLPVAEIVDIAHDAGARVLVDAVQAPGQTEVDVSAWGADAVAASGHKWLTGPWGAGFLYVDSEAVDVFEPSHVGYWGVEEPWGDEFAYEPDASRFEIGTMSPAPHAGLQAAIETARSVGIGTIESRIADLAARLADGLPDADLLSPSTPETGLVSFEVDDPETTVERLAERNVVIRSLPLPGTVRASVHAYNTPAEVDALLDGL